MARKRSSADVEPRGIYRERKGWGDQDSARVKYDEHQELDLPDNACKASRKVEIAQEPDHAVAQRSGLIATRH